MPDDIPLKTSGPLGRPLVNVTNEDLLTNAYEQNRAINGVKSGVQELKSQVRALTSTVEHHSEVINNLDTIKKSVLGLLTFVGLGGFIELLNYIFPHK